MNATKKLAAEVIYHHELKMEDALIRRGAVHPRTVSTILQEMIEMGVPENEARVILNEYLSDLRCAVGA